MSHIHHESYLKYSLGNPKDIEKNLQIITPPKGYYYLDNKDQAINKIRVNPICAVQFSHALFEIENRIDSKDLETLGFYSFGGGFNIRNMRGSFKLSAHAFGIAFDFSPSLCGYLTKFEHTTLSLPTGKKIIEIFKNYDFINYGDYIGFDSMHFEFKGF